MARPVLTGVIAICRMTRTVAARAHAGVVLAAAAISGLVLVLPAHTGTQDASSPGSAAGVAANSMSYQDATGENAQAADITTVTVSNDDARAITFRVNTPNKASFTRDLYAAIVVDTDKNASTGDPDFDGGDYYIEVFQSEVGLFRWDGTNFTRGGGNPPATTLSYSWSSGPTVRINASELASTASFEFEVFTFAGVTFDGAGTASFANAQSDFAPNTGQYAYDVRVAPPATNRVAITGLTRTPAQPVAGESFTVSVNVARVGQPGRFLGVVYCSTLPGVQTRWFGSVSPGRAACRWDIPASAAGKRIRGTISVNEGGGPVVVRRFTGRVSSPRVSLAIPPNAVTTVPARPASGSQFLYALNVVVRSGTGKPVPIEKGRVTCTASIDGRKLRTVRPGRVRAGDGDVLCGWEVPFGSSGRTLRGVIVVVSEGKTLTHRFRLRVR